MSNQLNSPPLESPPIQQEPTLTTNGSGVLAESNTNLPQQQGNPSPSPQNLQGVGYNNPYLQGDLSRQQTQAISEARQTLAQGFNQPTQGVAPQGYNNLSAVQQGRQQVEQGSSPYHPNMLSDFPNQGQPSGQQQVAYPSPQQVPNYTHSINNQILSQRQASPVSPSPSQVSQAEQLNQQASQVPVVSEQQLQELYARGYDVERLLQQGALRLAPPAPSAPSIPQQYAPSSQGFIQAPAANPAYVPQVQQAPQAPSQQGDIINGYHIDELVNRELPKSSQDGFASAETLVRQFGVPIETAAELINESHVRLEDWAMDLYEKTNDLAHLNVALQRHSEGQLEALQQQDELLKIYAQQMLDHQEFMKTLIPHVDRYQKMEELLLDSAALEEYWRNLRAVEAEHGTHKEQVAARQQEYAGLINHYTQELVNKGLRPEVAQQEATQYVNQQLALRAAQEEQAAQIPELPFEPGAILSQVDPSQLTKEQIAEVRAMNPAQLKQLEYEMAVSMGVIDKAGNLIQREQTPASNPVGGYRQFMGNQPAGGQGIDPTRIPPGMPTEARMQLAQGQAPQQQQGTPQGRKATFIEQVINGAVPPSTAEVNRLMAEGQYEATRPRYGVPSSLSPQSIRPVLPSANPGGGAESYPTLDELSPQQRFLLLDKLEREGVLGQKRIRLS